MGVVYQVCPFQALGPLTPIGEGLSPHVPFDAGWYSFLMKLATALLLLSVSASAAEPAFEVQLAEIEHIGAPPIDELLATLRSSRDRKEQMEVLDAIVNRAGGLQSDEQLRVVGALKDAYFSGFTPPEVRGKALIALGKCSSWFRDSFVQRDAILALSDAALVDANDQLSSYRVYALRGLSEAAARLPNDMQVEEKVVITAMESMRRAQDRQEKFLSLMLFHTFLRARGGDTIARSFGLMARVNEQLVDPLERDVDSLYRDNDKDADYRYILINSLRRLGWSISADAQLRHRIKTIFRNMEGRETDARLRAILREVNRQYAGLAAAD